MKEISQKINTLKNLLFDAGRNEPDVIASEEYSSIRNELKENIKIKDYLPEVVIENISLKTYRSFAKSNYPQFTQKDVYINSQFEKVLNFLKTGLTSPSINIYDRSSLEKDLNTFIYTNKKIVNIYGEFILKSKSLGNGGTSMVKGFMFFEKEYAFKFLGDNIKNKESKSFKRFKQAHLNLSTINCTEIIPQLHLDKLDVNQELTVPYIIMPKADSTLKEYIMRLKNRNEFDINQFNIVLERLFKILKEIHNHNIIHRDVKPENIFLYEGKFVLGDFDIASFDEEEYIKLHDTKTDERLANAYFSAPEQFKKGAEVTNVADLYSLGQIINWMITGEVLKGQSSISYPVEYKKLESVVRNLLNENPKERFQSIDNIIEYLKGKDKPDPIEEVHKFDDFVNKYTFNIMDKPKLARFTDTEDIKDIIETLIDMDKVEFEFQYGHSNNPFYEIEKSINEDNVYRFDSLEFKIKSIYFFKSYYNFADSLFIIETDLLNKAVDDKSDDYYQIYTEYKDKIFNYEQLSDGYALIDNKRVRIKRDECKDFQRFLKNKIIFISSRKSNLLYTNNNLLNEVCEDYDKTQQLNKELLNIKLKEIKRNDKIKMMD